MCGKLFPQSIDNTYPGHKAALWLFGLVVVVRIIESVNTLQGRLEDEPLAREPVEFTSADLTLPLGDPCHSHPFR